MESYWVLGQRIDFLATGETTAGHYSLFHIFIPAGPPARYPMRTETRTNAVGLRAVGL